MGSSDSAEAGHAGSGTTALLLTTLSGLSTGLGALVILAAGAPSARKLGHLLAFSAGVMVYLSFADLLFSSIEQLGFLTANIAVCCWPFFHLHHKPFFSCLFSALTTTMTTVLWRMHWFSAHCGSCA